MTVFCALHVRVLDGSLTYWLVGVAKSSEGGVRLAREYHEGHYPIVFHHMNREDNRGFEVKEGDYLIEETELQP